MFILRIPQPLVFIIASVNELCYCVFTLMLNFCVGLICLIPAVQNMHSSPTKLNLCHTVITSRGVNRLMEIVQSKCETANVLEMLDLSDNCLKGDDVSVSVSDVCLCETIVDSHCVNRVATH